MTKKTVPLTMVLGEISVLKKRIDAIYGTIQEFLIRPSNLVDPIKDKGGSEHFIQEKMDEHRDLVTRLGYLKEVVNDANRHGTLTVQGTTKTVAQWLIWVHDEQPHLLNLIEQMLSKIRATRQMYQQWRPNETSSNFVVCVDEKSLMEMAERLKDMKNELISSQLSIFNATYTVEV